MCVKTFFLTFSVLGVLISVGACNWLFVWVGFELNLIGFIPYLINSDLDFRSENGMKYYLVQAFGSILFAFGSILWVGAGDSFFFISSVYGGDELDGMMRIGYFGVLCVVFSLFLKLGSFPFHYWLPDVVTSNSWSGCLMILSIQKIAPFIVLFSMVDFVSKIVFWLIVFSALSSSIVGGIGGIGESSVCILMAYSSIGHTGWILFSMLLGYSAFMVYFVVYMVLVTCVFVLFSVLNSESVIVVGGADDGDDGGGVMSWSLVVVLLSFGGIPPFLGFLSKWMVISLAMSFGMVFFLFVLIAGSLLSLYYYLVLVFGGFFSGSVVMDKTKGYMGVLVNYSGGWFVYVAISLLLVNLLGSVFCLFFL
uniref:NADH-ubiquinone oxidoreductase chain 2 n=1 Tax=Paralepetopsis sp. TaxID=3071116 RepID=A0AA96HRS5_9GAST|nr:NADH dehydrogenase subunit 2 [Paralepetopsis sp.]